MSPHELRQFAGTSPLSPQATNQLSKLLRSNRNALRPNWLPLKLTAFQNVFYPSNMLLLEIGAWKLGPWKLGPDTFSAKSFDLEWKLGPDTFSAKSFDLEKVLKV